MNVAIVKWQQPPGLDQDICDALTALNYPCTSFYHGKPIPAKSDLVLTFGPWGRLLMVANQLNRIPRHERPLYIHWNLENPPDPRIPWPIMNKMGAFRSWIDRANDLDISSPSTFQRLLRSKHIHTRFVKFRYLGEYYYAHQQGLLDVMAETSLLFTKYHNEHGLPTHYVPWGTSPNHYKRLALDRDIDVLWMGKRRSRRRSKNIDRIRRELALHGINMYVADGIENPLIYGKKRSQLINRSRITLNVMSNWYDNSFHMRFHMVAGNGSMVISEKILPHYAEYQPGVHFIETELGKVSESIRYYLEHEEERAKIAANTYQLVSTKLSLENSLRKLMALANMKRIEKSVRP